MIPAATATPVGPTPCPTFDTSSWVTWQPPMFQVELRHPAGWQEIPGYDGQRRGGQSGFVMTNAVGQEGTSLDQAVRLMTEHMLRPYGTNPTVETLTVAGQDARLILPSDDQPQGMRGEAALVVTYPSPVSMGGSTYRYLVLYADSDHIRGIASTVRFL